MSFVEERVKKFGLLNASIVQTKTIVEVDISIDRLKANDSLEYFLDFFGIILCFDEEMFIELSIQSFVEVLESGVVLDSELNLLLFVDDANSDIVNIFMGPFVEDMLLLVLDEMSMQALRIPKIVRFR